MERSVQRVLVVEDESSIRDLVATVLRYEGFDVETAERGRQALDGIENFRPDLVVLDVMLPDLDGFEVQRRIANSGKRLPVLFLTARDSIGDRVKGLTLGGDDYVTKPFSLEEFVARVRSVLRRANGPTAKRLVFEELELDEDLVRVFCDGDPIDLTPTEFKLLRFLMRHPQRVLSKAQILDHVWDYDFGGDSNIVETYISYLRRKLDRGRPSLIHTVRGMGYCLRSRTG